MSVQVDLFPASRPRRGSLRMLADDGTPLRREYVCPAEDDAPLSSDELVRGYQTEDGEMIVVTDDELADLAPDKTRDMDLSRFVDRDAIPPLYFQRAYFLAPSPGSSAKAYFLLAEVMEETGRAGIATFVMRGKEYLVAIIAEGGVLRAETLRFSEEVRDVGAIEVPTGKPDPKLVDHMREAIRGQVADELDESELRDDYTRRLEALVEDKRDRGEGVVEAEAAAGGGKAEIIDLMEELKKRLGGERQPLKQATKDELYERAQALGIKGRSKMTKDQLAAAIERAEG